MECPLAGDERVGRRPEIVLRFNQEVDRAAIFSRLKATAAGESLALEMVPNQDKMVVRPVSRLPGNCRVRVVLPAGAESAEGPRRTTAPQGFWFKTYDVLRVTEHSGPVEPDESWSINFNNPLKQEPFRAEQVRVSPPISEMEVSVSDDTLFVEGDVRPSVKYSVTLAPEITDIFGQQLGRAITFPVKVSARAARLREPHQRMVVLPPSTQPRAWIHTTNLREVRVRLFALRLPDIASVLPLMNPYGADLKAPLPGRLVYDRKVVLKHVPDAEVTTPVDLSPALRRVIGQAVVVVEPAGAQGYAQWIQGTDIGLEAIADDRRLHTWTTRLQDGHALSGVTVGLWPPGPQAATNAGGLASVALPKTRVAFVTARRGADLAILPRTLSNWSRWRRVEASGLFRALTFDDRNTYRPGESVHFKAWMRNRSATSAGDLSLARIRSARYTVVDARGATVAKGVRPVRGLCGVDLAVRLPRSMALGDARLRMLADGGQKWEHVFRVEEFRRPEFEVNASAPAGPFVSGEHATVEVSARYYTGAGLALARAAWSVSAHPTDYRPPGWTEFNFNPSKLDWRGALGRARFSGKTDAEGIHRLRIDFDAHGTVTPVILRATAEVMDENRQAWETSTSLLVHPSSIYLGVKAEDRRRLPCWCARHFTRRKESCGCPAGEWFASNGFTWRTACSAWRCPFRKRTFRRWP